MRKNFRNLFRRPSIRLYFIVMNMVVLCLLFPSVSLLFMHEEKGFRDAQLERTISLMREGLESRGAALAHSMALSAEEAVAGYDFNFLNILVAQVVDSDPEILYCVVMDNQNRAVVHSLPGQVGVELTGELDRRAEKILHSEFPATRPIGRKVTPVRFFQGWVGNGEQEVLEAIVPLYSGNQCWGGIRLGFSLAAHQRQIRQTESEWAARMDHFQIYFLTLTAFFFSVGALVAAIFTRYFERTMHNLNDGVLRVSLGDLDHAITQPDMVCAEVMALSHAFNTMTDKLRTSYRQLDEYSKGLEQKVEERTAALREAQAYLLQQAHEAGMAEMAVGILHNIGNAITPAKVGATMVLKRIEESPVRRHAGEAVRQLDGVVTAAVADPQERERLLGILHLLPAGIEDEYGRLGQEVLRIRDKQEHIESIIKLQMRYARLVGASTVVDVNRLLEDALRMMEQALNKREVRVEKDFAEVPPVQVEETKLLQVFVNLIKNGYQAMDGNPPAQRCLQLATFFEAGEPGWVVFRIRDAGVGFSPEEEKMLFSFGYSTKEKGSGFGLHSCANYLIANGATISAASQGKGKGAEFIVRLLPVGGDAADGVHS
ncbi:MAG: ATP-binding protein [Desulfobulbaceae bacterium]|nr:ATP-binding protein [Desulfobulbaceae bacterium]